MDTVIGCADEVKQHVQCLKAQKRKTEEPFSLLKKKTCRGLHAHIKTARLTETGFPIGWL
jgi:hypothetical protein